MDESHEFARMDALEEEDYVSEALVRDSPQAKIRRPSKNQQFMMQIRNTHEALSQSSSTVGFGQRQQKTILFTKEVDDLTPDYASMEIKEVVKMTPDQLADAYNKLQKMIIPVFSGAVDTLINKIDPRKAIDDSSRLPFISGRLGGKNPFKKKQDLNKVEAALLEEHKLCRDALDR